MKKTKQSVQEIFNDYVNEFQKSPFQEIQDTEDGLSIQFPDEFYTALKNQRTLKEAEDDVEVFINTILHEYIKEMEEKKDCSGCDDCTCKD